MRRDNSREDDGVLRAGWGLTGLNLIAAATLAGDLARRHMASIGEICGGAAPHCGWCAASVALALSGLAAVAWSARPLPARARAADSLG